VKLLQFVLALTIAVSAAAGPALAEAEWVAVLRVARNGSGAIIQRKNGEVWTIEIGSGCPAINLYERRWAAVQFDGFFAGVGSNFVLPDDEQYCQIWDADQM
jgi:hypothetical protein